MFDGGGHVMCDCSSYLMFCFFFPGVGGHKHNHIDRTLTPRLAPGSTPFFSGLMLNHCSVMWSDLCSPRRPGAAIFSLDRTPDHLTTSDHTPSALLSIVMKPFCCLNFHHIC